MVNSLHSKKQKEMILAKAGALFWSNGYHKTNMKNIASACGFEAGNLYNYFKSKEGLLYEVLRTQVKYLIDSINAYKASKPLSPRERLEGLVKTHVQIVTTTLERSLHTLNETSLMELTPTHRRSIINWRDKYDDILRGIIRDGIASGDFTVIDEKMPANFITSIILRILVWYSPKGRYSPDELANIVCEAALSILHYKKINNE